MTDKQVLEFIQKCCKSKKGKKVRVKDFHRCLKELELLKAYDCIDLSFHDNKAVITYLDVYPSDRHQRKAKTTDIKIMADAGFTIAEIAGFTGQDEERIARRFK